MVDAFTADLIETSEKIINLGEELIGNDHIPQVGGLDVWAQEYVERTIIRATVPFPGLGERAIYANAILDPPSNSTCRGWGGQVTCSTSEDLPYDIDSGEPWGTEISGWEALADHRGTGRVRQTVGLGGWARNVKGEIDEMIGVMCRQPLNETGASVTHRIVGLRILRNVGPQPGVVDQELGIVVDDEAGPCGFGFQDPEAKLAINGGLNVGAEEDPGDGVIRALNGYEVGAFGSVKTGWTGTFTNGDGDIVTVEGGLIVDVSPP
jgi:hypothetical protein